MASDILTLNAGSSTLKFSLWQSGTGMDLRELFRGEVEKIGIDRISLPGGLVARW
jgi:acetate kinase